MLQKTSVEVLCLFDTSFCCTVCYFVSRLIRCRVFSNFPYSVSSCTLFDFNLCALRCGACLARPLRLGALYSMGDHWRMAPPGVCIHLGVADSFHIFMHACPWISHSLRPSHEFPTAYRACSRVSPKMHNVCSLRPLITQCATLFLG